MIGPSMYLRHARMGAFAVLHFFGRFEKGRRQLEEWLKTGELKVREHIDEGIEHLPQTLLRLFDGSHIGKLMPKVDRRLRPTSGPPASRRDVPRAR